MGFSDSETGRIPRSELSKEYRIRVSLFDACARRGGPG